MSSRQIGNISASHYYKLVRQSELEIHEQLQNAENSSNSLNLPSTSTLPSVSRVVNNVQRASNDLNSPSVSGIQNTPSVSVINNSVESYSSSYSDSDVDTEINFSDSELESRNVNDVSSDMDIESESDENKIFKNKLACFVKRFNLTRAAANELLKINREHGHPDLPRTREALLGTPMKKILTRPCDPGVYFHYGIAKSLLKCNYSFLVSGESVEIDINIDGVSLSKSTGLCTWPILGKFVNQLDVAPFIIGIYSGYGHPKDIEVFIEDFVQELNDIQENGVLVTPQKLLKSLSVRAFICDSPARAFVTGTLQFNSIFGCNKCHQESALIDSRRYFLTVKGPERTDNTFRTREHIEHHQPEFHQSLSLLESINIGMVSQFVIDPMHAVDLGVMKKILLKLFMTNSFINNEKKTDLDLLIVKMKSYTPYEFERKLRSPIADLKRWKAVECRMFLLYVGIVVLKDMVPPEVYYHFLLLSTAIRLVSNPDTCISNSDLAQTLLERFVTEFPNIYGAKEMVFNVHALLHIVDCVLQFGPLYNFSAYPFENFQREVKKYTRKPTHILQQVYKRLEETEGLNQRNAEMLGFVGETRPIDNDLFPGCNTSYNSFKYNSFLLKNNVSDSCCMLHSGYAIKVCEFIENNNESLMVGKKFLNQRSFFEAPVDSASTLGVLLVSEPIDELFVFKTEDVLYKYMRLPYKEEFVLIPLLHKC